ncbi:selenoprotein S [Orussus abietinus]|uniref:selenoprotein S n=1 Tax=Orussus abietinus TaxID=222816 RepID=UPI000626EAF2|nr:selenoprotein S [Orussus abietinus]
MEFGEVYGKETSYVGIVWQSIARIGWYLVGISLVLIYTFPYIQERYQRWRLKKDEQEYSAKYHKNPDMLMERLAGLEAARQRMQEKFNRDLELARQREAEKQEKKRQELLNLTSKLNVGRSLRSSENEPSTSSESKSEPYKKEYNPLTGDAAGWYRPPKRSCCRKGGCG